MAFSKSALTMDPFSGSRVLPVVPIPVTEDGNIFDTFGTFKRQAQDNMVF